MRSLPPPRYSRYRTAKRIGRAIRSSFVNGYISDSTAFTKSKRRNRTISKIRLTRITHRTTSRKKFRSAITTRVVNNVTNHILPLEILDAGGNGGNGSGGGGGGDILTELSKFNKFIHWLKYWPFGCSLKNDDYSNRGYGLGWNRKRKLDLTVRL